MAIVMSRLSNLGLTFVVLVSKRCFVEVERISQGSGGSHQWQRKLENFEGDRDKNFGVKGGYPLENLSVFAHLLTVYGEFCYFSFLFYVCLSNFSSFLEF